MTAVITLATIQGSIIQIGRSPKKIFRRVPPDTDATAAINAMPP